MDKYHFVIESIVQNLAALNLKVTMVAVAASNRARAHTYKYFLSEIWSMFCVHPLEVKILQIIPKNKIRKV